MSYINEAVQILETDVLALAYLKDFGRVEASVSLTVKRATSPFAEHSVILTSVDVRDGETVEDVRARLTQDAIRLWKLTSKAPVEKPSFDHGFARAA